MDEVHLPPPSPARPSSPLTGPLKGSSGSRGEPCEPDWPPLPQHPPLQRRPPFHSVAEQAVYPPFPFQGTPPSTLRGHSFGKRPPRPSLGGLWDPPAQGCLGAVEGGASTLGGGTPLRYPYIRPLKPGMACPWARSGLIFAQRVTCVYGEEEIAGGARRFTGAYRSEVSWTKGTEGISMPKRRKDWLE